MSAEGLGNPSTKLRLVRNVNWLFPCLARPSLTLSLPSVSPPSLLLAAMMAISDLRRRAARPRRRPFNYRVRQSRRPSPPPPRSVGQCLVAGPAPAGTHLSTPFLPKGRLELTHSTVVARFERFFILCKCAHVSRTQVRPWMNICIRIKSPSLSVLEAESVRQKDLLISPSARSFVRSSVRPGARARPCVVRSCPRFAKSPDRATIWSSGRLRHAAPPRLRAARMTSLKITKSASWCTCGLGPEREGGPEGGS